MGRRKKTSIEGVMYDKGKLFFKKNQSYKAPDGVVYIPRSGMYAKGEGFKIAIFDKIIYDESRFEVHQVVMNGEEFKKALGVEDEGKVTIV